MNNGWIPRASAVAGALFIFAQPLKKPVEKKSLSLTRPDSGSHPSPKDSTARAANPMGEERGTDS
ncbi:hypothetical protein EDM57_20380 [Brevibacillus gelatini]|uniref:Uncharacterized protein n=1 Tax=Brevibacillus gelatini TaxID=1655277 RepID=A0A3M8AR14_9BACL|nr:hypothetical protein EDM57_20380 [Brevibacillus gelatini]